MGAILVRVDATAFLYWQTKSCLIFIYFIKPNQTTLELSLLVSRLRTRAHTNTHTYDPLYQPNVPTPSYHLFFTCVYATTHNYVHTHTHTHALFLSRHCARAHTNTHTILFTSPMYYTLLPPIILHMYPTSDQEFWIYARIVSLS
jgi:hypothetical protein